MGAFMVTFIANMLPYFIFLWAISFTLFFNKLFTTQYPDDPDAGLKEIIPCFIALAIVIIFVILPIRTCINKCIKPEMPDEMTYMEKFEDFTTDYDCENPVTKKEGDIRLIELRTEKNKSTMS